MFSYWQAEPCSAFAAPRLRAAGFTDADLRRQGVKGVKAQRDHSSQDSKIVKVVNVVKDSDSRNLWPFLTNLGQAWTSCNFCAVSWRLRDGGCMKDVLICFVSLSFNPRTYRIKWSVKCKQKRSLQAGFAWLWPVRWWGCEVQHQLRRNHTRRIGASKICYQLLTLGTVCDNIMISPLHWLTWPGQIGPDCIVEIYFDNMRQEQTSPKSLTSPERYLQEITACFVFLAHRHQWLVYHDSWCTAWICRAIAMHI